MSKSKKRYVEKYIYALQNKIPNNYRIATLLILAISLSVTVAGGVGSTVRIIFGSITFLIFMFLGAIAQPWV